MRSSPALALASALGVLLAACGGGATDVAPVGGGASEPSVQIKIDEAASEGPDRAAQDRVREPLTVDLSGGDLSGGDDGGGGTGQDAASSSTGVATGPTTEQSASAAPAPPVPAAVPTGPTRSVVAHAVVPQVVARTEPADDAAPVASLAHPTEIGSPLVFLVDDGSPDGANVPGWVRVHLPVQPNGTRGWVRRDEVTLFANDYRIEVDRAAHRLRVFAGQRLWIETPVAIGTGETPTPVGEFYLLELLSPPDPTGPYGPYAFGLSGFSEVLDSFGGADTAVIGLHGTDDPSAIGTDVSFGCIRMANDVIARLAAEVPLGTPVVIT